MDFRFNNVPLVIAMAVAVLVLCMHVLSGLLSGKLAVAINIFNIFLHVVYAVLMFFAGAELDIIALSMMASVLVYSLVSYIAYTVAEKRKGGSADDI